MNQNERDAMAIRIAKRRAERIEKEMGGENHKARSFDVEDLGREADGSDTFPNRGQRSGDGRVFPSRGTGMIESQAWTTAGGWKVPLDPFIHGDMGEANANGGPAGGARKPLSGYVMAEPNVDARGERTWPGETTDSPIGEAGVFRPSAPGDVGGTPESSYVVKSNGEEYGSVAQEILNRKTSLFKSIMVGPTRSPDQQAADFMASQEEAK